MPKIYRQNCKQCNKYYESQNGKYCSRACWISDREAFAEQGLKLRGKRNSPGTEFKKGHTSWLKGKKRPEITAENNHAWKGDNVGYAALHTWVRRNYGTPKECSCCGTTSYRRYEWANISGKYSREREDWIRLCVPCHRRQAAGHILILNELG